MKIDGSCHCGAITFEAEVDPAKSAMCHCIDCQTISGSAFRTVVATPEADFKLLTGEPKVYIKTAESGNRRIQAFCGDCGTALYATSADGDGPKIYGLRHGAIRQRDQLAPKVQIWTRSAQHWLADLPALPGREKQS
jgi:hypothetical protein